ncbi:hypothetical protein A5780_25210 [Nocardia sp. 852002-20019_SCH5090214]|uniref:Uncharacterized protein n=1 Tax=Nocardia nova TaxID=37330 RepID=A0A2S6AQ54_9NOCA|nr:MULTISPECIES: hypothetical protein [Nocardia]MBV7706968.1 hypothetical protein [Nocardia nova]OBA55821.1 hypothetical protein A5780_25210 [Nocardia sp. 852002-20019_SCH5090214]PPI94074.1 hypothetical protein C5E46_24065 [Nocardia nova]PPJ11986.1 hypothetical protein C5E51_06575 [Nocardia nova]PPJ16383.1 hypothetical protein C5E44_18265 [Nocardia nova]
MVAEKDIDAADWVEQDLLTKQEAGERLAEEIVRVRARLGELRAGAGDAAAMTMVARRLAAMEAIRDSLQTASSGH